MQRRTFIASAVAPLANHVSRTLHTRRQSPRPPQRKQCAVLLLVVPPDRWRPKNWRDVPPATSTTPFTVVDYLGRRSLAAARQVAKLHNLHQIANGMGTWAVVAATDGRLLKGGVA